MVENRPPSTLVPVAAYDAAVATPEMSDTVTHGVRVGAAAFYLASESSPADRDYVFGFSCLIDAVIRGKEERVTRKGFDTFCPVGPWIVTADEVGDAASHLQGRLWVNGELKQDANTRDLILDIAGMIEMASSVMTLYPGDIIAAGTPAGVGPIRHGDKVKIEFERVGTMTLDVIQGDGGKHSIFAVPLPAESKP